MIWWIAITGWLSEPFGQTLMGTLLGAAIGWLTTWHAGRNASKLLIDEAKRLHTATDMVLYKLHHPDYDTEIKFGADGRSNGLLLNLGTQQNVRLGLSAWGSLSVQPGLMFISTASTALQPTQSFYGPQAVNAGQYSHIIGAERALSVEPIDDRFWVSSKQN
jgi:hypothetical protein